MNWKSILYIVLFAHLSVSCDQLQTSGKEHGHEHHDHDHSDHESDLHDHSEHDHEDQDRGQLNSTDGGHIKLNPEDFKLLEIQPQNFTEVIHTSGQILSAQGDEMTIIAIHNGLVLLNQNQLLSGKKVRKGQPLLTISGKNLVHDNIENTFLEAKTAYENAEKDYIRAKELNKDKIISDKEFAEINLKYQTSKNNFESIKRHYSSGGQKVSAQSDAYIKDVYVSEGEYVETGQALLKLTKNKRLVIKADVPQRHFPMLSEISSANFKTVYDQTLYQIEDLNGNLVSYGKTTGDNSLFTPVYFEIDNKGSLLAGSYIEVYLKTVAHPNSIVVPKESLLEESGRHYVYVYHEGEFEKRYVIVDCEDGISYHLSAGLEPGELVATKDPYLIKLASLSAALPAHSHSH